MKSLCAFLISACLAVPMGVLAQTVIHEDPVKTEPDPPPPVSVTVEQKLRAEILVLRQQLVAAQKQQLTIQANWFTCQEKVDVATREAAWQQLSKDAGCTVNRTTYQCEPSKP